MATLHTVARYRWVILFLAVLAQWSAALAGQVLAPLAPLFQPELGMTKAEVGIFSSATFAGALSILLVAGYLTDRFGIRKMMFWGQVVTGVLLLSMFSVGSALQAGLVMFAAGVGRGAVFPGASKAILDWFAPSARATAMGLKQTGAPVAGIVAAATLPAVALVMGWRAAVALAGILVIGSGITTLVLYRDPPRADQAPMRRASLRAGLKDTVRNRQLWMVSFIAVLLVMSQQSVVTYLALYFKEVVLVPLVPDEAARIVAAGGYLALCQAGGVVGRIAWGAVSDRLFHGRRAVVLALLGSLSAIMSLGLANLDSGHPFWILAVIVFLAGTTIVGWNGVYHALVVETAGRKYAATGVGLSMTLGECGSTVGPPLFGFVVDVSGSYSTGWVFVGGLCLAGALMALASLRGEKEVV